MLQSVIFLRKLIVIYFEALHTLWDKISYTRLVSEEQEKAAQIHKCKVCGGGKDGGGKTCQEEGGGPCTHKSCRRGGTKKDQHEYQIN